MCARVRDTIVETGKTKIIRQTGKLEIQAEVGALALRQNFFSEFDFRAFN